MRYTSEAKQLKDAVDVLCEREPRSYYTRNKSHMIRWREVMVKDALDQINTKATDAAQTDRIGSAPTKKELNKIRAALLRVKHSVAKLPPSIVPSFDGADRLLEHAETWLRRPARPKHRSSHQERQAVWWAEFLISVTDELPVTATRGGQWYRLAAILYGDDKANLYRHMLKHIAHLRSMRREWADRNQTIAHFGS